MDKNLIIAVVASTVFLGVWYKFFMPSQAPQSAPAAIEQSSGEAERSSASAAAGVALQVNKQIQVPSSERVIETDSDKIVIDSRGASIKHWWVKERTQLGAVKDEKDWPDMVNHAHAGDEGLGVSGWGLATYSDVNFRQVLAVSKTESAWLATLPSGLEIEKKYSVIPVHGSENGGFQRLLRLTLTIRNPLRNAVPLDALRLTWGPGLGTVASELKENAGVTRVLAYPSPKKEVEKFKEGSHPFSHNWTGIDNRYYLMAMMPKQGKFNQILVEKSKENPGVISLVSSIGEMDAQGSKRWEIDIYGGPKGYTQLKQLGFGLEHAVDFGMFGFLGKWALKALYYLRGVTGNYGWAIILLTVALQVIVLPLTVKSFQSTLAMKKLQPKLQELQKRYKGDAMRLNQETMKLYKESGTNPFGGCLPMILQIPVFWAFFTMLRNAYELHGAPWMGWIRDLSMKDPFYVLPLVMGGGMFLQQKLSGPVGGDPAQAKIMMLMPVVFTFMFLNFPSGLVLYWLTNSLVGIAVQYYLSQRDTSKNTKAALIR